MMKAENEALAAGKSPKVARKKAKEAEVNALQTLKAKQMGNPDAAAEALLQTKAWLDGNSA